MKFSVFAFLLLAFSTKSNTFDTADSPKSLVTSIVNNAFLFMKPERTSSSTLTLLSTDSPVRAEVSTIEEPSITIPSRGTLSPGLTTIMSPISTSSGSTTSISFPIFKFAMSGLISINDEIDFLDLPTAIPCKNTPTL